MRTGIPYVYPGDSATVEMYLAAPEMKGRARFRLTLVQELVAWFDSAPYNIFADCLIDLE
jgi:hypothetical protein